jgi:hypothetical protein
MPKRQSLAEDIRSGKNPPKENTIKRTERQLNKEIEQSPRSPAPFTSSSDEIPGLFKGSRE